jgi:FkbM family methyltransferase
MIMKTKSLFVNKFKILKLHYNKFGFLTLAKYVLQRLVYPKNKLIKISIPGYLYPVFLRNNASDTQIFTQIFVREELKIDLKNTPKTIIDGGANIGFASVYFKNKYPDSMVYSIEPEKSNYEVLLKNTSFYNNMVCYNCGIWNIDGKLKIINKDAGNESFIVTELDTSDDDIDAISAITINKIVHDNNILNIELIKLDIEGSEGKVFENNFKDWLAISENILVEIHNWIDVDAEKKVLKAIDNKFSVTMAGEYHFFSRL